MESDLCFDNKNLNKSSKMMEKILQKVKVKTYCENCKREFEEVWICEMDSIMGTRYALLCTGCQKLIGIYSSIDFIKQAAISNIFFDKLQNSLN